MGWLPAYFNKPVDPEDRLTSYLLRSKILPWSNSPFDDTINHEAEEKARQEQEEEAEEIEVEAVPQWLELFFDLAWAMTFSGVTSNTPIQGALSMLSYATFFCLVWWLWISQVLYDTKFYTNDWFHRIMLLLQFFIFGALAAFTDGFDITQGLTNSEDLFNGLSGNYLRHAFLAISVIFGFSRLLLALEYVRVIRFARKRRVNHLLLTVSSQVVSGALFLLAFFLLYSNPDSTFFNALKFLLWGGAIAVEVGAYLYTSMPQGLVRQGSMPERLATLTTVAMGEGLNGLIDPLVSAARSAGFNLKVGIQIFIVATLVVIIFMLYFGTYGTRLARTPARQKLVVLLHFPTQLCIILLFEGMKAVLNMTTLLNTLFFLDGLASAASFEVEFEDIGLNFTAESSKILSVVAGDPRATLASLTDLQSADWSNRLIADISQTIFNSFHALDSNATDFFENYISLPGGPALTDAQATLQTGRAGPFLSQLLLDVGFQLQAPATWVIAVAGVYLITLAVLALENGIPRNRFSWWAVVARIVGGVVLASVSLVDLSEPTLENFIVSGAFLPTIVLFYLVQFVIDYVIAIYMARSARLTAQVPALPPKMI